MVVSSMTTAPSWATQKIRKMNETWGMWSDMNKRNVERLSNAEKKGRLDFILYGDSISSFHYGYTVSKKSPGSDTLWKKHFGDINAVPLAIPGDQIGQVVWRLMQGNESPKLDPKVVGFLIGVNDLVRYGEDTTKPRVPSTADRMDYLLNLVRTTMPTTRVIVCALTPITNNAILRDRKTLNATYKSLVSKYAKKGMNVQYVDCSSSFTNDDGTPTNEREYLTDQVHLTAKAHDIVLGNMRRAVNSAASPLSSPLSSLPFDSFLPNVSTPLKILMSFVCIIVCSFSVLSMVLAATI